MQIGRMFGLYEFLLLYVTQKYLKTPRILFSDLY